MTKSLAAEKLNELGNDLIGRLLHQPVARALDDDALDVRCDELACWIRNSPDAFSPVSTSIGIGSGVLRELCEVLRVLFEGTEHLEASVACGRTEHTCARRTGGPLPEWTFSVGSEVVPEMLEINALAARQRA